MFHTALTLFVAGLLTILLPCILPLIPIVLGVSVADRHPLRPLLTILGMLLSFVASTFILNVLLSQFIELADYVRLGTFYVLLLFGIGFSVHHKPTAWVMTVMGAFFFWEKGIVAMLVAAVAGVIALETGGWVAARIQQLGSDLQQETRKTLGSNSLLTAFVIGLTMGLVWVPCAGPALGFALALVRNEPGLTAMLYLLIYAVGAGIPLLLIGYGGQLAVQSVRAMSKYTGTVKQVCGVLLILSAIAFRFDLFAQLQTWLVQNTAYGRLGTNIEEKLFASSQSSVKSDQSTSSTTSAPSVPSAPSSSMSPTPSALPVITRAPLDLPGTGPWHNSRPLSAADLKGKVVLVDFWTYSCINCIRTLPYIEGYWDKYKDVKLADGSPAFVLLGVHTPEFTFEKSEKNVAKAIKDHGLTYPVAQDNDFKTWNSFANQYWPAKYLIDAKGYIRYEHFGEGAYEVTDQAIASLLGELGLQATTAKPMPASPVSKGGDVTRETYLHSRSWPAFGNAQGEPSNEVIAYTAPSKLQEDTFYLSGTWQLVDDERQVLQSDEGKILIRARGGEVNLVLGPEPGAGPTQASVTVDGKPFSTFTIDHHDLYVLYKGDYGTHDVILTLKGKGVGGYAFTFGG